MISFSKLGGHTKGFQGSMAGLESGKSAYIQMNGHGYNRVRNRPSTVTSVPRTKTLSMSSIDIPRNYDHTNKIAAWNRRLK